MAEENGTILSVDIRMVKGGFALYDSKGDMLAIGSTPRTLAAAVRQAVLDAMAPYVKEKKAKGEGAEE